MAKGIKAKVLVVGCKGVGKSNFIGQITDFVIAASNRSHREVIGDYAVKFDERRPLDGAIFEAIPFDAEASRVSPAHVLYEFAEDFKRSYKDKSRIPGVILVHYIVEEAPDQRTLDGWQLLFDMLGDAYMPHLTIVTTKWGLVPPEIAEKRERQLIEHWRRALNLGARLRRFYGDANFGNRDEAVAIVQDIQPRETILPQLTQELCVQRRNLGETLAGLKTLERMHLDYTEKETHRANLMQAAQVANVNGMQDAYDERMSEIAQIDVWLAKLTHSVDCLEGRQRFEEPAWKKMGGVNGTWLGTAWTLF